MATLGSGKRRQLPDKAFAYVDSAGRRRLPIHDEAHVRNALARFDQVAFEDEAARDRARGRLLRAAKRYGIVPIGFVTGQLKPGRGGRLPTGTVTFLMADIEGSSRLLAALGDAYGPALLHVRRSIRRAVRRVGGHEVDAHGDEYFAAFAHAPDAFRAALLVHDRLASIGTTAGPILVRIGIHTGRPTLGDSGYVGIAVHAVARIAAVGRGGQTIVSRAAVSALAGTVPKGTTLVELGHHDLRGIPGGEVLFSLVGEDR